MRKFSPRELELPRFFSKLFKAFNNLPQLIFYQKFFLPLHCVFSPYQITCQLPFKELLETSPCFCLHFPDKIDYSFLTVSLEIFQMLEYQFSNYIIVICVNLHFPLEYELLEVCNWVLFIVTSPPSI